MLLKTLKEIRMLTISGNLIFLKTESSTETKRIISGKWVKAGRADLVQRSTSTLEHRKKKLKFQDLTLSTMITRRWWRYGIWFSWNSTERLTNLLKNFLHSTWIQEWASSVSVWHFRANLPIMILM